MFVGNEWSFEWGKNKELTALKKNELFAEESLGKKIWKLVSIM